MLCINISERYAEAIVTEGAIPKLTKLIDFKDSDHVKYESCRVLGVLIKMGISLLLHMIISSGEKYQQVVKEANGLCCLLTLLGAKFDILKKEALMTLKIAQARGLCAEKEN